MLLKLSVLFFTPLLSGLLIYLVKNFRSANFKLLLVFAGAYLFGITVVHILPELYRENQEVELIGLFVLMGFFLNRCWNISARVLNMDTFTRRIINTIIMIMITTITASLPSCCCWHFASMRFWREGCWRSFPVERVIMILMPFFWGLRFIAHRRHLR